MSDAPPRFTLDTSRPDTSVITKDSLIGLGAAQLAQILLDGAAGNSKLLEQVQRTMAQPPKEDAVRAVRGGAGRGDPHEPHMVGSDPAMQHVYDTIRKIAVTAAPILLSGESGTGKELAALAIHERSSYSAGPFVPINCGALPPQLIASELFGHEKGAFTGADQRHIGRIESAGGGTILLDEIGDLPLELQAHLLRFLQEGTIDRVGSRQHIKVDARVIAASNADLRQAVADGKFRGDLFYRLNVLRLELPPLRERGKDIDLLATYFLRLFAEEMGRPVSGLQDDAQLLLRSYYWPGNVRELIATVRRAVVMTDGDRISAEDLGLPSALPPEVRSVPVTAPGGGSSGGSGKVFTPELVRSDPSELPSLDEARREMEKDLLRRALQLHSRNIKRTAEHLGVSRVTLYRLMEKYSIDARGGARL